MAEITDVEVISPIVAEAEIQTYTLVSDDIYVRRYDSSNIPEWYRDMINGMVEQNAGVLQLEDWINILNNVVDGYGMQLASLTNGLTRTDAKLETLKSSNDVSLAGVSELWATKIDANSASAIASNAVISHFNNGQADAWFTNQISTYASATNANASNVSVLASTLDNQTVRIDTIDSLRITLESQVALLDTTLTNLNNVTIPALEAQVDNIIETFFGEVVPTSSVAPESEWIIAGTRDAHLGDLYYNSVSGLGYRYVKVNTVYSWSEISDSGITAALAAAAKAQDTADGKRTIYGGSTIPAPSRISGTATIYLAEGDIWIPSANVSTYIAGEVYRCTVPTSSPTQWVLATTYTAYLNSWITNTYGPFVTSIQSQTDAKAEIFYQSTSPRTEYTNVNDNTTYNKYVGDMWKDTSALGGNKEYIYTKTANGSKFDYKWTETAVPDLVFDTIDGKAALYTTNSPPTKYQINDLMVVVNSPFNNGTTTYAVGVLLTATTTSTTYSATHWVKKINDTEDLDAFVDAVNPTINALKGQIDGTIESYFQLSTAALPSVGWTSQTTKDDHHGDLLYFTDTREAKRYNAVSNSWVDAGDMTTILAEVAAAQAAADGKATVYYKTATEINVITTAWTTQQKIDNVGDIWIDSATNISKIWNGTGWVNVATVDANTALAKLSDLEEARDGNIVTYYTTSAPTINTTTVISGTTYTTAVVGDATLATWQSLFSALTIKPIAGEQITATASGSLTGTSRVNTGLYGDYWVDTNSWVDVTHEYYNVYRYSAVGGTSTGIPAWRVNTGETAVALGKAYRANVLANTAQGTADGKVKTWYQTTAPTGLTTADIGDIWVDTDAGNLTKTWSGSAWEDIVNTKTNTAYTWSAEASKMITAPDGSITGWSFGDGSNIESTFKIKATNFSVSDGATGYTPFSITGTDINFNGKVTFSNITGSLSKTQQGAINTNFIVNGAGWTDDTVANTAQNIANIANANAMAQYYNINPSFEDWSGSAPNGFTTWSSVPTKETVIVKSGTNAVRCTVPANTNGGLNFNDLVLLPHMPNDEYLSISITVRLESGTFAGSGVRVDYIGTASDGVTATDYYSYLHLNLEIPNPEIGRWYTITKIIKRPTTISGWIFTRMDGYLFGHYSGMHGGYTGAIDIIFDNLYIRKATAEEVYTLETINKLANIASDNILSPSEKSTVIADKAVIDAEQSGIDAQATSYNITTEKTAYDTAITSLTTYLATLTTPVAWNVITGDTTIVGTTFRTKFSDVYTTRQTLLNAISAKAKSLVDTAQSTANSKTKSFLQASTSTPTALTTNDTWYQTDTGLVFVWSGTAWVDTTGKAGSGSNIMNALFSDFELSTLPTITKSASATVTLDTANSAFGTRSLKLVASGLYAWIVLSNLNSLAGHNINITPNKKWIVSCWVYLNPTNSPKTVNNIQCYLYINNAGANATRGGLAFSVPTGVWTRARFLIDLSAYDSKTAMLRFDNESFNALGNTTMYIDGIMIEEQIGTLDIPSAYSYPSATGGSLATLINANTTTIDGGKITTGTLQANSLKAGTNDQTVWTGGGLVSTNFNGTPYGNIGNPTQGFRLSSNAAGTSADPNIYGAYIKGGHIQGATIAADVDITTPTIYSDTFRIRAEGNPNNSCNVVITDISSWSGSGDNIIIYSNYFYSPKYSSGYNSRRVSRNIATFHIDTLMGGYYATPGGDYYRASPGSVSYSLDGGSYIACGLGAVTVDITNANTIRFMTSALFSGGAVVGKLNITVVN